MKHTVTLLLTLIALSGCKVGYKGSPNSPQPEWRESIEKVPLRATPAQVTVRGAPFTLEASWWQITRYNALRQPGTIRHTLVLRMTQTAAGPKGVAVPFSVWDRRGIEKTGELGIHSASTWDPQSQYGWGREVRVRLAAGGAKQPLEAFRPVRLDFEGTQVTLE